MRDLTAEQLEAVKKRYAEVKAKLEEINEKVRRLEEIDPGGYFSTDEFNQLADEARPWRDEEHRLYPILNPNLFDR